MGKLGLVAEQSLDRQGQPFRVESKFFEQGVRTVMLEIGAWNAENARWGQWRIEILSAFSHGGDHE
jgi:hypothetical protein